MFDSLLWAEFVMIFEDDLVAAEKLGITVLSYGYLKMRRWLGCH